MFVIRTAQLRVLEDAARADFAQRLHPRLKTLVTAPDVWLNTQIEQAIKTGERFHFTREHEVARYCELMILHWGSVSPDSLPKDALNVLLAHGVEPAEKLRLLDILLNPVPAAVASQAANAQPFASRDIGSAVQSCPLLQQSKPVYWIEIEMIGEDGHPISWEQYEVLLPDGELVSGYLDAEGWARIENISQPGSCRISFPDLDQQAWVVAADSPQGAKADAV
jgi:hypothetical protein